MKIKIMTILIIPILLTGCWSKNELNDITLTTSMAIDKEDDEFVMSISVVVPSEASITASGISSPTTVLSSKGVNACDAFRKITSIISRIPNLAHVQNIIISEEIAKEGVAPILDSLIRDDHIRPNILLFIAKEMPAKDVLKINTSVDHIVSTKIHNVIINAEKNYSLVHSISLINVINNIATDDQEAYLPGIEVIGDVEKGNKAENIKDVEPAAEISLTPYAVFKKDKLIGWLDDYTSKGTNILHNKVKSTMINLFDEEDYYSLDVVNTKTKIKAIIKNNKPIIEIKTNIKGQLCQTYCDIDLSKSKNINTLEKKYQDLIKKQLDDTIINLQQEYNSDILGLKGIIHRKDKQLYKKINKNWDKVFSTLNCKIDVNVTIIQPGSSINSLKKDIK